MRFTIARFLGLAAGLAATVVVARADAAETSADVETDHIDAADDGGPRALGVLVHPLFMATGWWGAEFDASCGQKVVISVEGDGRWLSGNRAYRASVGAAFYPQRFSFHGLYVHPTVQWERAEASGVAPTALGAAVTVGYAWTWASGPTVRLGGGVAYAKTVVHGGGAVTGLEGFGPEVDGDIGWVF